MNGFSIREGYFNGHLNGFQSRDTYKCTAAGYCQWCSYKQASGRGPTQAVCIWTSEQQSSHSLCGWQMLIYPDAINE